MNIILGTAQFGGKYGILNESEMIETKELEKFFEYCLKQELAIWIQHQLMDKQSNV